MYLSLVISSNASCKIDVWFVWINSTYVGNTGSIQDWYEKILLVGLQSLIDKIDAWFVCINSTCWQYRFDPKSSQNTLPHKNYKNLHKIHTSKANHLLFRHYLQSNRYYLSLIDRYVAWLTETVLHFAFLESKSKKFM